MRKLYQEAWHGISFDSFYETSSTSLADSQFYEAFYKAFFEKYSTMDDLDPKWVSLKIRTITHLETRIFASKQSRILSVGCGLGVMEMALVERGYSNVEVTETSNDALRWIRQRLAPDRIHLGTLAQCVPSMQHYDTILLSSVDYFLDAEQIRELLQRVYRRLCPGGNCTMISWSLESGNRVQQIVRDVRDAALAVLDRARIRRRGQMWGYLRTKKEYRAAFEDAGFSGLTDEMIDTATQWETYRMTGFKNQDRTEDTAE